MYKHLRYYCLFPDEFYEEIISLETATVTFLKGKLCSFQYSSQKYTFARNQIWRRVTYFS